MTFFANHYGDIHEADLGAEIAKTAAAITEYNPTEEWMPVEE